MSVPANIGFLRWAKQSVQGTAVADAASVFGAYLAGGSQVAPMRTDEAYEETTALRMRSDRYASEAHAGGDPEHFVMPNAIASLLYGVLGATSTSGAGDPYTHTLTPATALPWWTVWRGLGALIFERFVDCKVVGLVIHGETGKPLRVTVNWLGLSPQFKTAAETAGAIELSSRYLYYDGVGGLKLEGTAQASIDQFDLTITNNGQAIGGDSFVPIDISEGELVVTLAIRKLLLTTSLRNRVYYNSATPSANTVAQAVVQELAGSPAGAEFLFTRAAGSRTLKLAVPRVAVVPYDVQPSTNPTEVLREAITLEALQPADLSAPITATVLTGRATPS